MQVLSNTVPDRLQISPTASTMTKIALQLAIFVVVAVPGFILAIARLDKIGHRRLQLTGSR